MSQKVIWKFVILTVAIMILFPIITNTLMFVGGYKVAGDDKTWIGYFGSFWGAIIGGIISGVITLIGVKMTIDHNENQRKREEFPRKLVLLEELINYLQNKENELQNLSLVETIGYINIRSILFSIDKHYNIERTEKYNEYTVLLFEEINKKIAYVDGKSYKVFYDFRSNVEQLYFEYIDDLKFTIREFRNEVVKRHNDRGTNVTFIPSGDLSLNEEERERYNEIQQKLEIQERKYITKLYILVQGFKNDLFYHKLEVFKKIDY